MIDSHRHNEGPTNTGATDEEIFLLGQPALWEYLEFVKESVVGGSAMDPAEVAAEWRAAHAYYESLESSQSGLADSAQCSPLPVELSAAAALVRDHPTYRKTYDTLPSEFGLVELDKLVVCQNSVTWSFVDAITARLGAVPALDKLFDVCMPLVARDLPVQGHPMGSKRFIFRSVSNDFRFHEAALLRPDQISGYHSFGPVSGAVGLVVGFGSNFLSVIKVGTRLLLHDGYHRACALRSLGVTHVPCVITPVATHDELEVIAKTSVARNPDFFFKSHRPPLLMDYFDPKIRKSLTTHKLVRMIEVSYEVKEYLVPA